jgi:hypothetical protein
MPRTTKENSRREHENDRFENATRVQTDANEAVRKPIKDTITSISSFLLQNSQKLHEFWPML